MKDWVNSAGIRTCGSRDPRYFGSDSQTTQMAGGKGQKIILIKKGPYLTELWIWIPSLQLTPGTHICTNQRAELAAVTLANLRSAECSCGHTCLSELSRSLALTLNHVCMFFFCVPDHFKNLWFYTIFCLGGFSCLFFYVSLLILNRQLTELKFKALLKGQILKSACMISDRKSHCIGSG